tara:strand:+ start:1366 stop:2280 length:915 start_codon:yes stop_codon:yes gene_type:complete
MTLTVTKPVVGGSNNAWGQIINTALDDIVLEINSNADGTNPVTLNVGGTAVTATGAELNILDGANITTTELNVLDGDTSATSTTVVAADRVVFNDDGVMKQVAMSDLATYIGSTTSSGTVTSVNVSVPTGLSVSGGPVTTSGTIAISLASGFAIPTTSSLSQYDTFVGYGNHAAAGYINSIAGGTGITVTGSGANRTISANPSANGIASTTRGAVGSYAWIGADNTGPLIGGSDYSTNANNLHYAGFLSVSVYNDDTAATIDNNDSSTLVSGTWKAIGNARRLNPNGTNAVTNRRPSTLMLRIA